METSTTLKVHATVQNMGYFDFSDELWFDMDTSNNYNDELTVGCTPETVVRFMRNFVCCYLMPNDQLNKKGAITKLNEHSTDLLKESMTKLYDYFNAES
tara:strand:+ start:247 stop:543 length:297 start_codon:yes stop_codon:yes gene_type:complete